MVRPCILYFFSRVESDLLRARCVAEILICGKAQLLMCIILLCIMFLGVVVFVVVCCSVLVF